MNAKDVKELLEQQQVAPVDQEIFIQVKAGWDAVAKPIDSMGKFEKFLSQVGAIQKTKYPSVEKSKIIVFAADNGIVEEGISQSGQEITAICANNIAEGLTSVCVMAKDVNVEIQAVDIGVNAIMDNPKLVQKKVRMGTRNFFREPAMTEEETLKAIGVGIELAKQSMEEHYDILGIGEIGIGNTTTSSAVATALLGCKADLVTGRGAGLTDDKLKHKREVVQQAVDYYDLYHKDAFTVLQTVGGFDIAGMTGLMIGASLYGIPVVLDGFISMVAALVAEQLMPGVMEYIIPSHMSREPAAVMLAEKLDIDPVILADMALGEGTGAVLMLSLLRTANCVYKNTCLFEQVGIEQYKRY